VGKDAPSAAFERPRLDRASALTGAVLAVVALLAWLGVVGQAGSMSGDGIADPMGAPALAGAGAFVVAWAVMMAAMMLPSATPMIALYGAIHRGNAATGQAGVPTALFALTYLVVWAALGVPVYLLGIAAGAFFGMDGVAPAYGVALALVAAGAFQLTPLKTVCLRACRSPLGFLMGHWRAGTAGTLRLGLAHALYCVGCCWALMAVLVAAGAMGLAWVILIALAVFAEKLLPRGELTARVIGVGLIALGATVLVRPELAVVLRGGGL
jgi:predicted metal-binding membrane protein